MSVPWQLFVTNSGTDANAPTQSGAAMTGTATVYSKMFSGRNATGFSAQLQWTGTPTGAITVWYSNKPNPNEANDADWIQDTTWTHTDPAGGAGQVSDEAGNARAYRKRFKYVNASGAGTLTGYVTAPKET